MEKILLTNGHSMLFLDIPINPTKEILYEISDDGLKELIKKGYKLKREFNYWEFD